MPTLNDLNKTIYEHMKCLAGELLFAASSVHARAGHSGPLSECKAPMCAHRWEKISLARELEQAIEDPDYTGQFSR